MAEEQAEARWGTSQLFLVKATNVPQLAPYYYPSANYNNPQFVFPVTYIAYPDQKGAKHYLSILPKAPGFALSVLFKKFPENPSDRKTIQLIIDTHTA